MRLIHISDLHLGKRLCEYSLIADQRYILLQILQIIDGEQPDAVLVAGDIYDKSVPSAEAVQLFDDFLAKLAERKLAVFIISGNHDSPERIAYGCRIMDKSGIYLSPVYNGKVSPIILKDEYGPVNVYLLPFVKPANVRACFPEEEIESYTDAVRAAVGHMGVDQTERNVLVTHQFVTGASRTDSEIVTVGGTDNVDASVFEPFDYVALGHIHRPQNCGSPRIRYSGTPLKYSFSEVGDRKSVTVVELGAKEDCAVRSVALTPLHDMTDVRGSYDEITRKSFYENTSLRDDYVRIILTDEEIRPGVGDRLRTIYHNWVQLVYDNKRTQTEREITGTVEDKTQTPLEIFADLYEKQNNLPMDAGQRAFMAKLIDEVWGEAQ